MRVAINGFGRIGRAVLRQVMAQHPDIEIVHINDIGGLQTCAYLLKYDSVYGPYPGQVEAQDALVVAGQRITFSADQSLSVDLSGVDVLLECTGKAKTRDFAESGLRAGASNILISGPSEAATKTLVIGVNETEMGDARIVSNASCTTNAIGPLLMRIPEFEHAHITTIHVYTGSQPMVDAPRDTLARSRAGAVSMVPTTTSAEGQIEKLLPKCSGRLSITAVRVPSISVSAIDAVITFKNTTPNLEAIQDHVIGATRDACVSTDMRGRTESLILALPETRQIADRQMRIFGWYDNEWGFAARMIEMAKRMHDRTRAA